MDLQELERRLKVDRSVLLKFISDIGLDAHHVASVFITPTHIEVKITARDETGKGLLFYERGKWEPVHHVLSIPIMDSKS